MWRTPEGWTARRYHLGTNKGVFGTEVYAIYRALRILDQRQESGHRYVIFVDSTSIIERIRTDAFGPGQRFDIATMEVCSRILARENKVTVRWVPAHYEIAGNEKTDDFARATAEGGSPEDTVSDEYRWETSLSHMTRVATEARSRATAQWIADHVEPE